MGEAEKALLRFLAKVNGEAHRVREEEVLELKGMGWSEEAVYDALTVCALFNFYNRWVDGSGVRPLSPKACRLSAQELVEVGYVQEHS